MSHATTRNPMMPMPLPAHGGPLYSLHAGQLMNRQGQWEDVPNRLFLQAGPEPQIVALCGTSGDIFPTATYNNSYFRLGEQTFLSRNEIREFFVFQTTVLEQALAGAGAVQLTVTGSAEAVTPENGAPQFPVSQLRAIVGGSPEYLHFDHGPFKGFCLVVHSDGKYLSMPINALATHCWLATYTLTEYFPVDVVVGTVLLVREELI